MAERLEIKMSKTVNVTDVDISSAIQQAKDKNPGMSIEDIWCGGYQLNHVYSRKTGNVIWYRPGCPCGEDNCTNDPMLEIALGCSCQNELTPAKCRVCQLAPENAKGTCCYEYETY